MKKISITFGLIFCMLILFNINVNASDFQISHTKLTVNIGDTYDLNAIGTEKEPIWTSYHENIVSIDKNGVINPKRIGKTTIKARIGTAYKTCSVTVVNSSLKLNKTNATIYVGGTSSHTVQLKATAKGATKDIIWNSSNTNVATVDDKGKVTSVKEGTAIISATANGKTANCSITVKNSDISLNMNTIQLSTKGIGSSIKLNATVIGSKKNIKWSSSDKTIATISNGKVNGKKEGTAVITATANGVSTTCNVNVIKDLISLQDEKILLYVGENKQLKTNANKNMSLIWSSSDEYIVTVENGIISAKEEGSAVITVEYNGKQDSCEVTVKNTVTNIEDETVYLRTKGNEKTYVLKNTIIGKKNTVKWTSSDNKIVSVNKGRLTAKKVGTAIITATANGVSDSVTVCVEDFIPTIKLNQNNYILYTLKGNSIILKATVNGNNKNIIWNSSNDTVASVSTKGKVTAITEGETIISATANGVTAECLITVKNSQVLLEKDTLYLDKGEKENIPVDVIGVSQAIKWTTTNNKVATIKNGMVTAKNYGEADIKITANGVTSVCHIKVSACEHTFDDGSITKESTCLENGTILYTCTRCNYSYEEILFKTEHNWTDWIVIKEATIYENGEQKRTCAYCGKEELETIPMIEHIHHYEVSMIQPSCTEDGYTLYTCECGEFYIEDLMIASGHKWNEWIIIKEPTVTEKGNKMHTCKVCNIEEYEEIDKHIHHYEETIIVIPTCKEEGIKTYICECGDSYNENIDKLEHKYEETVIEPTCTEEGGLRQFCNLCGETKIKEGTEKPSLGHNYEIVDKKDATCTENGLITYHCNRCNTITHESIQKSGHNYIVSDTKTLTCTENGYTEYKCTTCNETYKDNETFASGHTYGHIVETVTPINFETFGSANMICPNCNEILFHNLTAVKVDIGNGNSKTMYGYYDYEDAKKCFDLTYQYKEENGFFYDGWEYKWSEDKYKFSCIRVAEMAYQFDTLEKASHSRPNGVSLAYSENMQYVAIKFIGMNPNPIEMDAKEAFQNWLGSKGHKDNIESAASYSSLAKFKAWIPSKESWSVFWVQNF